MFSVHCSSGAGKVIVSLGSAVIGPISVFSRLREVELSFPKLSMYLCRECIGFLRHVGVGHT